MYNARKRGEDRASDYFKRTENVAGVKDMRFQALMPDILHWLGITKIDRMLSMSKYVHTQTHSHTLREGRERETHTGTETPAHMCPMLHSAAEKARCPPSNPRFPSLDGRIRSIMTNVNLQTVV